MRLGLANKLTQSPRPRLIHHAVSAVLAFGLAHPLPHQAGGVRRGRAHDVQRVPGGHHEARQGGQEGSQGGVYPARGGKSAYGWLEAQSKSAWCVSQTWAHGN